MLVQSESSSSYIIHVNKKSLGGKMYLVFTMKTPAGKVKHVVRPRAYNQAQIDVQIEAFKAEGMTNITWIYR